MYYKEKISTDKILTAILSILLILQFGYNFAYRKGIVDGKISQITNKLNKFELEIEENSKKLNSIQSSISFPINEFEKKIDEIKSDINRIDNVKEEKFKNIINTINNINYKLIESLNRVTDNYYSIMKKQGKYYKIYSSQEEE